MCPMAMQRGMENRTHAAKTMRATCGVWARMVARRNHPIGS
jgi:hypothetical protein